MAITINQAPVAITPAYEDIVYVVSSTNNGETNFKYVVDVIVKGNSFRLTMFPHPSYGTAYVNIGKIIETYLTSDIDKSTYGFQECKNSFEGYTVQFGEQYGSTVTVYPNLEEDTRTAWNANINFLPFQSYDGTGYVMLPTSGTAFLTNQPANIAIRDDEDAWLYGITNTSGTIGYAEIITKDSAGATIQTVNVQNPFTNTDVRDSKMMRLSTGTSNLNNIPSSGISLGAQPIITASVASYEVLWKELAGTTVSTTQTYTINNACTRNNLYRFHFINAKGGFDSFTFYRADKKSTRIERSNYKKNAASLTSATTYGYDTKARTTIPYNTKLTDNVSVLSDWISEDESAWLEELISSPEVYLEDATYGLVSVVIQNPTYDTKQVEVEKLFNLRISFRYSYDRFRQRY